MIPYAFSLEQLRGFPFGIMYISVLLSCSDIYFRCVVFSEEELAELFGKFGELSEVHLVLDKMTKRSKAMAFILYLIPECAVR